MRNLWSYVTATLVIFVLVSITSVAIDFWTVFKAGPLIPGLDDEWVPQGLAFYEAKKWLISSHYWGVSTESNPSILWIVDEVSGKQLFSTALFHADKSPHAGHVGGLAVSKKYLWVASEESSSSIVLAYSLADLEKGPKELYAAHEFRVSHAASYATYHGVSHMLFVGQFAHGPKDLCEHVANGTVQGYQLDADDLPVGRDGVGNPLKWNLQWTTADRLQGMAIAGTSVFYSQSCGRTNNSTLIESRAQSKHTVLNQIVAPTMSEGIVITSDGKLYVSFESAARKYLPGGTCPLKNYYWARINDLH